MLSGNAPLLLQMSSKRFNIKATVYDKRGRILATAVNSYRKSHTLQAAYANRVGTDYKIYLHAEILAIIRVKERPAYKIKIERYDSEGNPRLAMPCPICQLAIQEAGIKFVEYTT